jgi:hypothetical protein
LKKQWECFNPVFIARLKDGSLVAGDVNSLFAVDTGEGIVIENRRVFPYLPEMGQAKAFSKREKAVTDPYIQKLIDRAMNEKNYPIQLTLWNFNDSRLAIIEKSNEKINLFLNNKYLNFLCDRKHNIFSYEYFGSSEDKPVIVRLAETGEFIGMIAPMKCHVDVPQLPLINKKTAPRSGKTKNANSIIS